MHDPSTRLEALLAHGILDTPPEPEFDDIVQIAQRVCQTPVALVSLVAADRQWFKARVGFPACETPLSQSVCAYALEEDDLLVITDLTADPRTRGNALVTGDPFIRFYAGAPILTLEKVAIGSLCVIDTKPRPEGLTPDQAETLRALSRQTTVIMAFRKAMLAREAALTEERLAHGESVERVAAIEAANERFLERARASEAESAQFLVRALVSEAASDRLRDAEAMVRGAQDAARIGAFEVDIKTNMFTASAAFCRIFGLPERPAFSADELEALILPEDRGRIASSRRSREDGTAPQDVEYRIYRHGDQALRWIARRSAFAYDESGNPTRMLGVVQDITDRKINDNRNRALISLGDQLRNAKTTAAVGEIAGQILIDTLSTSRGGYGLVDEALDTYTVEGDRVAPGISSIMGVWPNEAFRQTIDALREGAPFVVANVPAAGWLRKDAPAYARAMIAAQINIPLVQDGALVGVLFAHSSTPRTWSAAEIDFTVAVADRAYATIAKIKAEVQQRFLNEELSHRLKNTLSMVQAIAGQTLRGIAEKDKVKALEQRIIALSKAHDVLLQQSWSAAPVSAVIKSVLGLHVRPEQFGIVGPDMTMGPKATLSLSLLLHELATNSIKYGALSVQAGRIGLGWRLEHGGPEPMLVMEWVETGGPPASPPTRRGFGTRLIGMGLAGVGNAELDYGETGLRARFTAPLHSITSN